MIKKRKWFIYISYTMSRMENIYRPGCFWHWVAPILAAILDMLLKYRYWNTRHSGLTLCNGKLALPQSYWASTQSFFLAGHAILPKLRDKPNERLHTDHFYNVKLEKRGGLQRPSNGSFKSTYGMVNRMMYTKDLSLLINDRKNCDICC